MSERLAVALQYALPKRLLTQLAGKLAGLEGGKAATAKAGLAVQPGWASIRVSGSF